MTRPNNELPITLTVDGIPFATIDTTEPKDGDFRIKATLRNGPSCTFIEDPLGPDMALIRAMAWLEATAEREQIEAERYEEEEERLTWMAAADNYGEAPD